MGNASSSYRGLNRYRLPVGIMVFLAMIIFYTVIGPQVIWNKDNGSRVEKIEFISDPQELTNQIGPF